MDAGGAGLAKAPHSREARGAGMPCYGPLKGYRGPLNKNGKRPVVFNRRYAVEPIEFIDVPCGQCVGCRLERSRQWAMRCMHEVTLHEDNCFVTLTYDDASLDNWKARNIPAHSRYSVNVREFQLFMKRLRKSVGADVRVFYCGEYGAKFGRPHYHAILFNLDFGDKYAWSKSNDQVLYRSPTLEKAWPFGYSSIGSATFESAAYCARYILKKVTGDRADNHYRRVDPETGEVFENEPEFARMSKGIGRGWYERFKRDAYPHDAVWLRGRWMKPPKFYDGLYEVEMPDDMARIKNARRAAALTHTDDQSSRRLRDREVCQLARLERLPRNMENM